MSQIDLMALLGEIEINESKAEGRSYLLSTEGLSIVQRVYQFASAARNIITYTKSKTLKDIFNVVDEEYVRQAVRYNIHHTTFEEEMKVTAFIDIMRWKIAYSVNKTVLRNVVPYAAFFVSPAISPWCAFTMNVVHGKCGKCPLVEVGLCGEGERAEDNFFYRCSVAYPPVVYLLGVINSEKFYHTELSSALVAEARKQMEFPDAGRVLQHYGLIKI